MRILFKTNYKQDLNLAKHGGHRFWYGLLILVLFAAPIILGDYYIGEATRILIYAMAGLGLMVLTGFTGQVSLGHAAFFGDWCLHKCLVSSSGIFLLCSVANGRIAEYDRRSASRHPCCTDVRHIFGNRNTSLCYYCRGLCWPSQQYHRWKSRHDGRCSNTVWPSNMGVLGAVSVCLKHLGCCYSRSVEYIALSTGSCNDCGKRFRSLVPGIGCEPNEN